MANTTNRNYPKPDNTSATETVVQAFNLLRTALDMVDGDVNTILTALAGKALADHGHDIADITGLVTALNAKMDANASISLNYLSDVDTTGALTGNVLAKVPGGWAPANATDVLDVHQHEQTDIIGLIDALAGKATVSALAAEAALARDASNLTGTVPIAALLSSAAIPFASAGADGTTNIDTLTSPGFGPKVYGIDNPGLPLLGYWYILTLQYATASAVTQIAIPYGNAIAGYGIHIRGLFGGAWSIWEEIALKSFVATNYPVKPKTAAGAGQWVAINAGDNVALPLPAGGTWAYLALRIATSGGGINASSLAGVAAGGSTVGSASAGSSWRGFAWRVSE